MTLRNNGHALTLMQEITSRLYLELMKLAMLGEIFPHPLCDLSWVRDLHISLESEHLFRVWRQIGVDEHHTIAGER